MNVILRNLYDDVMNFLICENWNILCDERAHRSHCSPYMTLYNNVIKVSVLNTFRSNHRIYLTSAYV